MPDTVRMWVCSECEFAVFGDECAAHGHHHQDGCWGHWLYEFGPNEYGSLVHMTGRHIHTSDVGGFYIDDHPIYGRTIQEKFVQSLAHERQLRLRKLAHASTPKENLCERE